MAIRWAASPTTDDLADASAFLALIGLQTAWTSSGGVLTPAKDLLRAAGLSALPRDNAGVKKYLDRISKGTALNPPLVVTGAHPIPLVIAEGYHRVSAVWHTDEAGLVRNFRAARPR